MWDHPYRKNGTWGKELDDSPDRLKIIFNENDTNFCARLWWDIEVEGDLQNKRKEGT